MEVVDECENGVAGWVEGEGFEVLCWVSGVGVADCGGGGGYCCGCGWGCEGCVCLMDDVVDLWSDLGFVFGRRLIL